MPQVKSKRMPPLLRWAGSKRKLLPVLANYWNQGFERYVEPFMGSACLFFSLQPKRALLNDLNEDLVNTYKAVRSYPEEIAARLKRFSVGKTAYYDIREQCRDSVSEVDAAATFIYLNRFAFNGLYRTNLKGVFNVPYGGGRTGQLPSVDRLKEIAQRLRRCTLRSGDFEPILAKTKAGDFVYLDPPFAVSNRRVFKQYGPQNFGLEDLKRLALALIKMDQTGVRFVVSYAYCKEALHLLNQWQQRKVFVQRNIAGFATERRLAAELIVSNIPLPP